MTYIDFSRLLNKLFEAISLAQGIVGDPKALRLLRLMENPGALPGLDELKDLIRYGYINKVLFTFMHYGPRELRSTTLYRRLLEQRRRFLRHLAEIVNILDRSGVDYVVFKTLRPVIDVPVDIDIIVGDRDEAHNAVFSLKKKFRVEVWAQDTYSISIRIADFREFVDFYIKPHAADIVYLDPELLLKNRMYLRLDEFDIDILVPVPRPEEEFCAVLSHAVIKERLITLNDILSLLTYYRLSSWDYLLSRVMSQNLNLALSVLLKVRFFFFPQKLSIKEIVPVLYLRTCKKETFFSLPYFIRKIGTRFQRFIEYAKRVTYLRGFR